jgi:hypothetical protein
LFEIHRTSASITLYFKIRFKLRVKQQCIQLLRTAHIPRLLAPLMQMILSVTTVLPYVELHSALLMTGTVTLRSEKKNGLIAESAIQFFYLFT